MEHVTSTELPLAQSTTHLEELDRRIQALRVSVAGGEISLPFAVSGINSIIDGSLAVRDFPIWISLDAIPEMQTCMNFRQFEQTARSATKKIVFERSLAHESFWEHKLEVYGPTPTEGCAVRVRPADLGFKGYKKLGLARVYERASELGLRLCPPKIAYFLRLAYTEQPVGEWLLVATPPIEDLELRYIQLLIGRGPNQGIDSETEVFHLAWRRHDIHTMINHDQEIIFMKA